MQIYKRVYFGSKTINFIDNKNYFFSNSNNLLIDKPLKSNLDLILQNFEIDKEHNNLYLLDNNIEHLFIGFTSLFELVDASGGLVRNEEKKYLFIFRLEKWDLPKGKIEDGENAIDSALREVREETGIADVEIINELPCTYHIYFLNDKRILKRTQWFEMYSASIEQLTPQVEENITMVKWLSYTEVIDALKNTYGSIESLVKNYFKKD
jgi:ADP-ribose pyrophosphatase YjhB (NUDIX family)